MRTALVFLNIEKHVTRGAGYIASSVLAAGHDLDYLDMAYETLDEIIARVLIEQYDILLISASSLFMDEANRLATEVKRVADIPILLGGVHAIIAKDEILKNCPAIDYICVGEGEEFIVEFLDVFALGGDVKQVENLGYRLEDTSIVINPIRSATNLDKLPPFRYDLFHTEAIVQEYPKPGFCYVWATRGCPYRCTYCSNTSYLDLYRKNYLRVRNVDATIAELIHVRDNYPVKFFYFGDEMILFDKAKVAELFHRVKSEVGMSFGCMIRVEAVTPDIVELFRETGCRYVAMGVECGDEKFRKEFLNRRTTNDQIFTAFKSLKTIEGMTLTSFNMTGYPVPYDDELTKISRNFNSTLGADIHQWSTFYPFPGTKLYDYCIEHNLIDHEKVKQAKNVFTVSVVKKTQ